MKTTHALSAVASLAFLGLAHISGCSSSGAYTPTGQKGTGGSGVTGTGGSNANTGGSNGSGGAGTGTGAATGSGGSGADTGGSNGSGGAGAGTGAATGSGGVTTGATGGAKSGTGGTPGAGGTASAGTGGSTSASGGATGTAGWGTPVSGGPTGSGSTATVTVETSKTVGNIGPSFVGISYEKTHITNASLTGTNANMIALYKLLGTPLMRLGANDVDLCTYTGTGSAPAQPSGAPFSKSVNSGMVDQLCSFLAAAGTKVIYGINYNTNTVSAATAEAAYVMNKCGSSIYGFEIGNELSKDGVAWSATGTSQYDSLASAVMAAPGALLVGPACTSGSASTAGTFATAESSRFPGRVVTLTQHYYVAGGGTSGATVAALQTMKSDLDGLETKLNGYATSSKITDGWRLGEVNTFYYHGQQGVSDTLVEALWALDLMFLTAQHGGSGVNFHSGEDGQDGTKPFYYEPIKELNGAVTGVQPEYYGMLLFALAGTGPMVSTTVTSANTFFTAYAIKANGFTSVVLDNKSSTDGVNATVNMGAAAGSASAIYLQGTPAGSLTATAGNVTLAGAPVTNAGGWNRSPPYIQTVSGNNVTVHVPPASAALLRVLP